MEKLQIFEVAPSLHMVEVRKAGGDTLEFHKVCELDLFISDNSLGKCCIVISIVLDYTVLQEPFNWIERYRMAKWRRDKWGSKWYVE